MSVKRIKDINASSHANDNTGFGSNTNNKGGRFVNRDGSFNLRKTGGPLMERVSIYHTMLHLPSWKFSGIIVLFYITINLLYTSVYFWLGPNEFTGMLNTGDQWKVFKELYFFSTETFTTVGYGRVNPVGDGANFVASLESLNGFLSLAIFTGLIYGRFSKPRAYLAFSDDAVIAPYKDKTGLMFRFACYKNNHTLTDVEVTATIALLVQEDNKAVYRFFDLPLERSKVQSLPMNWTVVHPINEQSPLLGLTERDLRDVDVELYILVKGFDDVFSNVVQKRTSYTHHEIRFNRKFIPMYHETDSTTILELHKLNETIILE
jgi:inward rectifier potassium channel